MYLDYLINFSFYYSFNEGKKDPLQWIVYATNNEIEDLFHIRNNY